MKLVIESSILKESLNKVQATIDKKNTRPLLTNYFIETKDNQLEIIGTDLEVSAKNIINCEIQEQGKLCINAKGLTDIVRELPDGKISLSIDSDKNLLKINVHNINYSLLITNSQDFPFINFDHSENKIKTESKDLKRIIEKTSYAISTDETRIFLNGILFQENEGLLRAVAIDGHRLALLNTQTKVDNIESLTKGIIIPRKGISELKKMCETDSDITMSVDDSFIYFSQSNQYFLSVRLIARDYPKYQAVIPEKTSSELNFNKQTVLQAVRRIKLLSNEKTNGIKCKLKEGYMTLEANHPSLGEAREELCVNYAGEPIEIGFNAKYLIDSLNVIDGDQVIFEFNNELSPVIVKSNEMPQYLGIIMPLKI